MMRVNQLNYMESLTVATLIIVSTPANQVGITTQHSHG